LAEADTGVAAEVIGKNVSASRHGASKRDACLIDTREQNQDKIRKWHPKAAYSTGIS
jgi:hypothetical protein